MLFWGSSKNLYPWWMQGKMQTVTIPTINYLCRPPMPRKKAYLVGFLCQLSTLSHSAPSHLSVDPLVPGSTGVAGAESRAIGISLCPAAIISFALTTHLLFTFTPENGGRQSGGPHRGSGKSRRWWTWKWAFPPFTEWMEENVVSYLSELGSWPRGYSCWSTSSHLSASDFTVKLDEQAGKCCL